ncbi:MAG: 50S ribosomal protein L11 methyltransferase [Gammaproteobacteria bacterium]|nr:MAG: 50S ribosomal protein L11 methyltransferase [Gammaproteobacteria bacterium]RLA10332.1 MAG: 50S ribosomal protein L11 methyltransferase [Gammaproteobacteria bacterium]RLA12480.1 MAG: 50S ribosomal protein L11 methyltransferase [Gammaproteobacteria bacterium]
MQDQNKPVEQLDSSVEADAWQQLRITLPATQQEAASDLLTGAGALAITLEDPGDDALYEPLPGEMPLWQQVTLVGLFPQAMDLTAIRQLLSNFGAVELERLVEREWSRVWLDDWQPLCFGGRLWVVPSWDEQPRSGTRLLLDPGLAFGTGTHATTALCLEWLAEHQPVSQRVIDFGCGSGVLAVAACCLGAETALAVDIDPQALVATASNAQLNGVAEQVVTLMADKFSPSMYSQADLLVANILFKPLSELAAKFAQMLKPGGNLVLSGLLSAQAEAITDLYRPWFDMECATELNGWIRIRGVRRNA